MCGIVGYTGAHEASPILVSGLRRLEYRGYDSAGLATVDGDRLWLRKRAGRVRALEELLDSEPAPGTCGISHTRWATHGPATDRNAHPHLGGRNGTASVAVVHNGVIENHAALRRELESQGFAFLSQTDTEVIAHLIARELESVEGLFEAVQRAGALHGLEQSLHGLKLAGDQVGDDFGIGLAEEGESLGFELAAQGRMILDHPVVHHGDRGRPVAPAQVGMRVAIGGRPVRGPSRV